MFDFKKPVNAENLIELYEQTAGSAQHFMRNAYQWAKGQLSAKESPTEKPTETSGILRRKKKDKAA